MKTIRVSSRVSSESALEIACCIPKKISYRRSKEIWGSKGHTPLQTGHLPGWQFHACHSIALQPKSHTFARAAADCLFRPYHSHARHHGIPRHAPGELTAPPPEDNLACCSSICGSLRWFWKLRRRSHVCLCRPPALPSFAQGVFSALLLIARACTSFGSGRFMLVS